jgi:hypothetical protein
MATSGSTDFALTRDDIITEALELCGAIAAGETIPATDLASAARKLNMMVKAWMAHGLHLWALEEATLFLGVGTQSYSLGATGTHCTNSYVQTTLSADAASGATSLTLTATTGLTAADNIGIVLDSGAIHWTTIDAVGPPTTLITGLAGAASEGAVVFAYTAKINRPQRIVSAYRRSIAGQDTPIELIGRDEYAELSNKTTQGKCVEAFYDPQLTLGVLYTWPTADIATDVIRFWYERVLEDFDATSNNPDFPIEWGEALTYGLADRLAPGYGLPLAERQWIKTEAKIRLGQAVGFDRETASVSFAPDYRR